MRRGSLGIAARQRPLDRWLAQFFDLKHAQAVEVIWREPDGPAEQAGLKEGDLIVGIDDQAITSVDTLHRLLAAWPPKPMTLTIIRGLDRLELPVVPVEAQAAG